MPQQTQLPPGFEPDAGTGTPPGFEPDAGSPASNPMMDRQNAVIDSMQAQNQPLTLGTGIMKFLGSIPEVVASTIAFPFRLALTPQQPGEVAPPIPGGLIASRIVTPMIQSG